MCKICALFNASNLINITLKEIQAAKHHKELDAKVYDSSTVSNWPSLKSTCWCCLIKLFIEFNQTGSISSLNISTKNLIDICANAGFWLGNSHDESTPAVCTSHGNYEKNMTAILFLLLPS